jgi:hypothetical protein
VVFWVFGGGYYWAWIFFLVKKGVFSTGRGKFLSIVKKKVDLLFEAGYIPALEKLCRTG